MALIQTAKPADIKALHPRDQCMGMDCEQPPTTEVKWANGKGHAWFCDDCRKDWEHKGDIDSEKAVKHGVARRSFSDVGSPVEMKVGRRVQGKRKAQLREMMDALDGFREQLADMYGWADYSDQKPKESLGPPELRQDGKAFDADISADEVWEQLGDGQYHVTPLHTGYNAIITKEGGLARLSFEGSDSFTSFLNLDKRFTKIKTDFTILANIGIQHGGQQLHHLKTLLGKIPVIPDGATVTARIFDVLNWGGEVSHRPLNERLRILHGDIKTAVSGIAGISPALSMKVSTLRQMRRAHRRFAKIDGSGGLFIKALKSPDGGSKMAGTLDLSQPLDQIDFEAVGTAVKAAHDLGQVLDGALAAADETPDDVADSIQEHLDSLPDDFKGVLKMGGGMMAGSSIHRRLRSILSALESNNPDDAKAAIRQLLARMGRREEERENNPGKKKRHDYEKSIGDFSQFAIKTIREEEHKGQAGVVVGGYMALYGSPDKKDVQGDYFTPETKTWIELYDRVPALFHHGLDAKVGLAPMGHRVKAEALDDGVWVEDWINKSSKYWRLVEPLLAADKLFYSPGSAAHLVKRADDGKLLSYPIIEDTMTPTPAQHRLMNRPVSQIKAVYKELGIEIPADLAGDDPDAEVVALKAALEVDALRVDLFELGTQL